MRLLIYFLWAVLPFIFFLVPWVQSVKYEPNWRSIDSRPLPAWYDKAKVGIFIHFGVFSVPSFVDEWFWNWWLIEKDPRIVAFMAKLYKPGFTYPEFAPQLTTEFFDAQQWAALFAKSGAKYVVLTTKHHEGFTLWPSKYSPHWNARDIGPKRDILGELAAAVRESGLHFGTYYSLMEWFHPLYVAEKKEKFNTTRQFVQLKIRPEMEELVNTYKPDIFWSDGDAEAPDSYWKSTDFLAWLYNDSPVKDVVVVNDRWGLGTGQKHGGFYVGPDRFNPGKLVPHKWENAMTIDKQSWGFRREAFLDEYMTIDELLYELVSSVAYGGNLLINVGPTADGRIRPIFEERLLQLGQWLQLNGEGIYESTPWRQCQKDSITDGVWYTQKDAHTVYGFVQQWPEAGLVEFGCIQRTQVASVRMLGSDGELLTEKGLAGTVVHFPQWNPLLRAKHVFAFKFSLL